MACHHIGIEFIAKRLGKNHRVEKHRRLRNLGLLKVLLRTLEHEVCYAETENFVSLLKKFAGSGIVFIKVFAHPYKLGALPGKHECFHIKMIFQVKY